MEKNWRIINWKCDKLYDWVGVKLNKLMGGLFDFFFFGNCG